MISKDFDVKKNISEKAYSYEFESASQLLEDFWEAVDQFIKYD